MNATRLAAGAACAALLSTAASAQVIDYPDFSSVAGLTLNADASQVGNVLRVSSANISTKGSVYFDQPVSVAAGFATTFTFRISNLKGQGADGFAFIIQNSPDGTAALGDHASALGYSGFLANPANGIDNALVVEFDTFLGASWGDPSSNHTSVQTGGTGDVSAEHQYSLGQANVPADMSDGAVHTVQITYDGATIEVFVDDLVNPLVSAPWSFATGGTYIGGGSVGGLNLIGGDSAYVGFTASAGGDWEDHDILSWQLDTLDTDIGTSYCGPANLNSAGLSAEIAASGSTIVANNDVTLLASLMPANKFAYFINSQAQGFVSNPGGSQGNLCLSGGIGRHTSQIGSTGSTGTFSIAVDLTSVPTPSGPTAVLAGETWNWQCWYRDNNPNPTSNFTDGVSITFQ